jgi:hypothetical protein
MDRQKIDHTLPSNDLGEALAVALTLMDALGCKVLQRYNAGPQFWTEFETRRVQSQERILQYEAVFEAICNWVTQHSAQPPVLGLTDIAVFLDQQEKVLKAKWALEGDPVFTSSKQVVPTPRTDQSSVSQEGQVGSGQIDNRTASAQRRKR